MSPREITFKGSNCQQTSKNQYVAAIFLDAHPAFILLCTSIKLRHMSKDAINYK